MQANPVPDPSGAYMRLDGAIDAAVSQLMAALELTNPVSVENAVIDAIAAAGDRGPAVYGVNTGFGALAETRIQEGDVRALQRNLVRSHSCGVGPDLGEGEVRAMMLLRAQVVALGYSGVRAEVIDLLIAMLGRGVSPRIPAQGSVGASGDLAPLAHLALVLIGEGVVRLAMLIASREQGEKEWMRVMAST